MSQFYHARRSRNLFDPKSREPFRLSRTKLDLFLHCPRCFYVDRRLGIGTPPPFPLNLNTAVDVLMKKEFDIHRAKKNPHPMMKHYGIDAVPLQHERMDEWRDSLRRGIRYLHPQTHFLVTGGVDDLWVNTQGELLIVDYKATAKNGEVSIDAEWQISYKRQMEVYQWLFRKNHFRVSNTGYFVYVNGKTDREAFDAKLEFDVKIIPYEGSDAWVENALMRAYECLCTPRVPDYSLDCDFCAYVQAVHEL